MNLRIVGLSKQFAAPAGNSVVVALQDISFDIARGGLVSLIGPSGCGKTTLLRILAGLDHGSCGTVLINDRPPEPERNDVGFIFQNYALFPWRTVQGNIEYGLQCIGMPLRERRQRSRALIERFGLDGFEQCYPAELSGGMQQRVAIARTMVTEPDIILMDEPFGALDSFTRQQMQVFLLEVWRHSNTTIVFVTHSIDEAVSISTRAICLTSRPGRVGLDLAVELAHPRDVTSDAFNNYRRRILEFLNGQHRGGDMTDARR